MRILPLSFALVWVESPPGTVICSVSVPGSVREITIAIGSVLAPSPVKVIIVETFGNVLRAFAPPRDSILLLDPFADASAGRRS